MKYWILTSLIMLAMAVYGQESKKRKPIEDDIYYRPEQKTDSLKNESTSKYRTLQENSIFIEAGGNGYYIGSINFERILYQSNAFYFTGRFGLGFNPYDNDDSSKSHYFFSPILLNFQFQFSNSFVLEIGAGPTFAHDSWEEHTGSWKSGTKVSRSEFYYLITGLIGIRVQTEGGFLFRAGFTPIYNKFSDTFIPFNATMPWGGVSFGYSFD